MKISILIPMYNAQKFIGNCLNSLLNQDLLENEYEIIVMDDGSTDESVNIVKRYCNKHKNIVLHEEQNVGAYSTRNKLLKLAKGDYIYNLDADDYVIDNSIKHLLNIAEKENADIIAFDTKETSKLDENTITPDFFDIKEIISNGFQFLEKHRKMRHEVWWYFVKRDLLNELNLSFTKNEYNADVLFTLQLFSEAKKIAYISYSIHRYVTNDMSIMRKDTSEARLKRINNMQSMIIDTSQFINDFKLKHQIENDTILNNLNFRRDLFTFFNMIKMVQARFSVKELKTEIEKLKSVKAYPINSFIGEEYNTLNYQALNFILNNKLILFGIVRFRNTILQFVEFLNIKKK